LKRRRVEPTMTSHPVIVQAGCYAAEMFAAHEGRQHVIGLIVVGELSCRCLSCLTLCVYQTHER
jgi:hypothetical protein